MPSPFPGMDPYIESQEWEDFHAEFMTDIRALLALAVPPRYFVRLERRVYEVFLTLRERGSMEVITVVELLSPSNKRPGADGYREYRAKRASVLNSAAHLVELDLLRRGERLPTIEALPKGDYYAIVSPRPSRPRARVYSWTLRDPLPTIPIPMADADAEVFLDLQSAFVTAYDRARYEISIDYDAELVPPLAEQDAA